MGPSDCPYFELPPDEPELLEPEAPEPEAPEPEAPEPDAPPAGPLPGPLPEPDEAPSPEPQLSCAHCASVGLSFAHFSRFAPFFEPAVLPLVPAAPLVLVSALSELLVPVLEPLALVSALIELLPAPGEAPPCVPVAPGATGAGALLSELLLVPACIEDEVPEAEPLELDGPL